MIGIYTITNVLDNKIYVGLSTDIEGRFSCHLSLLRYNKHDNEHLQRAFNKYGENSFRFEVLVECEEKVLSSEEHYWCNLLNVHDRKYGYNKQTTHPDNDYSVSEETRELIRQKAIGRIFDGQWRSNIAKSARNRKGQSYGNRVSVSAYNEDGSLYIKFDSFKNALRHFDRSYDQHWLLSRAIKSKRLILGKYWNNNTNDTYYLPEQIKKKRKSISDEVKVKMSISRMGHKQSPKTIEKRMMKVRGRKKPEGFGQMISLRTSKKIICTNIITGDIRIFDSVTKGAIELGVTKSTVQTQLKKDIWRGKYKLEYYENQNN